MKKLLTLFVFILFFISITGCAETPDEGEAIYSVEYVSELENKVKAYESMLNQLDYVRYDFIELYLSVADQGLLYEDYLLKLGYENFIDDHGYIAFASENDFFSYDPYDNASKKKILDEVKNNSYKDLAIEVYN